MTTVPAPTPVRPATSNASALLRRILRIDAWSTAIFGVVLLAGSALLSGPLGLPSSWSIPFGIAMLGGAGCLGLIAGYHRIPTRLAAFVIAGNALSCIVLVVLAFSNLVPLTSFGIVFLLVGALVVATFAAIEFAGLRRSRNEETQ